GRAGAQHDVHRVARRHVNACGARLEPLGDALDVDGLAVVHEVAVEGHGETHVARLALDAYRRAVADRAEGEGLEGDVAGRIEDQLEGVVAAPAAARHADPRHHAARRVALQVDVPARAEIEVVPEGSHAVAGTVAREGQVDRVGRTGGEAQE